MQEKQAYNMHIIYNLEWRSIRRVCKLDIDTINKLFDFL